ncbi:MAG: hypothetical protein BWK80_22100 [Desulfobacteraceae bacterium IS3]|nr:MAG: hypothetical protein BWK80_22100 [Desulfobacteraceae bacterium IS3]
MIHNQRRRSITLMMKCKTCGKEISINAIYCSYCGEHNNIKGASKVSFGETKPKKIGCLSAFIRLIGVGFLILFFYAIFIAPSKQKTTTVPPIIEKKPQEQSTRLYKIGETVHVGYFSYAVWSAIWKDSINDNQFFYAKPDAYFLFIEITIRNNDKKANSIPRFTLIDETGSEYETSNNQWKVKNNIVTLESINPGIPKQGVIVFDVHRNHKYTLKVSGHYFFGEYSLIEITP